MCNKQMTITKNADCPINRLVCQLLIGYCLLAGIPGLGQHRERLNESSFNPAKFEKFTINLEFGKKDKIPGYQYSSVQFLDARADTSKLGFALAGSNNEYHRLLFPKPAGDYLNSKINPLLQKRDDSTKNYHSKDSLLFVLKDLWVSQVKIPASFGKRMLTGPIDNLCFCYFSSDCYLVNDKRLEFLGNIDTVVSLKKWIVMSADDLLKKTIITVMTIADSLLSQHTINTKAITQEELNANLQSEYNFPILNTPLRKGIFLSYNDFLMNTPAEVEFKVGEDKKREYLESKSITEPEVNNAWGYSDGTDIFFHINDKFYRMVRSQNTFELAGPRNINKMHGKDEIILHTAIATFLGGIASGGFNLLFMDSNNKIMKELVPYQLNIKKGTIY